MRKAATVLFVLISLVYTFSCESDKKPEALLITGGHAFDTASFFDFFYSIEMIELDTISQPGANEYLATEEGKNHDIYIFYDMWTEISEDQKQAYLDLTEEGKSLLFLHHSLVSYQEWDTFKHIVGGRYRHPSSTSDSSLHSNYAHDLDLIVNIEDPNHPITDGMDRFIINDEGYGNLELINSIDTLLTTSHPNSHPVIGWTNHYGQSDIVYLIFGHDKKAYQDPDFRVIIENSIKWLTRE
jgi:hypothetical protein